MQYNLLEMVLYTNARARLQTSPAAVGSCSLTNCKHIFRFYYKIDTYGFFAFNLAETPKQKHLQSHTEQEESTLKLPEAVCGFP